MDHRGAADHRQSEDKRGSPNDLRSGSLFLGKRLNTPVDIRRPRKEKKNDGMAKAYPYGLKDCARKLKAYRRIISSLSDSVKQGT